MSLDKLCSNLSSSTLFQKSHKRHYTVPEAEDDPLQEDEGPVLLRHVVVLIVTTVYLVGPIAAGTQSIKSISVIVICT